MSITIEGTIIMRAGKICPEAIAQLSTEQLKRFLVIHALIPHPATLDTTEVQAAVRAELLSRGIL